LYLELLYNQSIVELNKEVSVTVEKINELRADIIDAIKEGIEG
jgi:hypothetical protein